MYWIWANVLQVEQNGLPRIELMPLTGVGPGWMQIEVT